MSHLEIKVLALLTMTIDHVGVILGTNGWDLLPFGSSLLRAIGRISFPLFAFCLAQGWHRTQHKKQYFQNLMLGAVVSQIPFVAAFYPPDLTKQASASSFLHFSLSYLFLAAVAIWIYWRFILHSSYEWSLILLAVAALLPGVQAQVNGFEILCEKINVFYTFLMAFFCLFVIEHRYQFSTRERTEVFLAAPILLIAYGLPADYGTGLMGIVLIAGFATLKSREQQAIFLVLWSLLFYGYFSRNWISAEFCALAAIVILLYDPAARGRFRIKKVFYWYYPVHLTILGFFNAAVQSGWLR